MSDTLQQIEDWSASRLRSEGFSDEYIQVLRYMDVTLLGMLDSISRIIDSNQELEPGEAGTLKALMGNIYDVLIEARCITKEDIVQLATTRRM
jgi:hypothetical protein